MDVFMSTDQMATADICLAVPQRALLGTPILVSNTPATCAARYAQSSLPLSSYARLGFIRPRDDMLVERLHELLSRRIPTI